MSYCHGCSNTQLDSHISICRRSSLKFDIEYCNTGKQKKENLSIINHMEALLVVSSEQRFNSFTCAPQAMLPTEVLFNFACVLYAQKNSSGSPMRFERNVRLWRGSCTYHQNNLTWQIVDPCSECLFITHKPVRNSLQFQVQKWFCEWLFVFQ